MSMGKVKLNMAGFRQVRQSAGVMHELTVQAQAMKWRADSMHVTEGAEYDYAPAVTTDRGSVALCTTGKATKPHIKAMVDNAHHNTLLKAVK